MVRLLEREERDRTVEKNDRVRAYIGGCVFALMVGFSFLAIKISVPVASTIEILTFRYDFAVLGSMVPLLLRLTKVELSGKRNKALFWSASCYIGFMILQTFALVFASSIESAILFAIIPILAKIIAGIFLGEKSTLWQNLFVSMSVASLIFMIVMSATDVSIDFLGVVILILSSLAMAVSNVLMRYVRKEHSPFSVTVVIATMGFAVFNAAYLVTLVRGDGLATYFAPCTSASFVVAAAYLGIPCLVISSWLMSYMLAHMEAVKATIFGNLSTAISIVAGTVILQETLHFYYVVCTAVIIAGVIGVSMAGKKEEKKEEEKEEEEGEKG